MSKKKTILVVIGVYLLVTNFASFVGVSYVNAKTEGSEFQAYVEKVAELKLNEMDDFIRNVSFTPSEQKIVNKARNDNNSLLIDFRRNRTVEKANVVYFTSIKIIYFLYAFLGLLLIIYKNISKLLLKIIFYAGLALLAVFHIASYNLVAFLYKSAKNAEIAIRVVEPFYVAESNMFTVYTQNPIFISFYIAVLVSQIIIPIVLLKSSLLEKENKI